MCSRCDHKNQRAKLRRILKRRAVRQLKPVMAFGLTRLRARITSAIRNRRNRRNRRSQKTRISSLVLACLLCVGTPAILADTVESRAKQIVAERLKKPACKNSLSSLPDRITFDKARVRLTYPPPYIEQDVAGWTICRRQGEDVIYAHDGVSAYHDSPYWLAHVILHEFAHLKSCSWVRAGALHIDELESIAISVERACFGHFRSDIFMKEEERH